MTRTLALTIFVGLAAAGIAFLHSADRPVDERVNRVAGWLIAAVVLVQGAAILLAKLRA